MLSNIPSLLIMQTFELFDINNFLPEIQVAFELAPSKEFAASGFQAKDLFGALFSQGPSIRSFADFVKRRIIPEIIDSLQGLFNVQLSLPSDDLTATLPEVGGDGISLGEFTEESTQSFPPVVTIDKVQVRSG